MYHYTACGLDNIYLKNGYQQKETPSGATTAIHDMDSLHKAIAKGVVAKEACLTPKEFRFLRGELDLSQKMLGVLFDKTDQMIAKWEKAETKIPLLADKAIRDLYMERIGEGVIAHLLETLSQLDRKDCEMKLELEETENGWMSEVSAA